MSAGPRVAVVHDYFTQDGGAERVALRIARMFPGARLYASVADAAALPDDEEVTVTTTPLQRLRSAGLPLGALAPLLPGAFARLDLDGADVVISSSAAFAHHVRPSAAAVHISYCHTPPRFLWQPDEYFRDRPIARWLVAPALGPLRRRDVAAAGRVDVYVANSAYTAGRIRATYGRTARVVHPPIDTAAFRPSAARSGRFLVVARLRRHKRLELAIGAAKRFGLALDVIGIGSDERRLRRLAGSTVSFLGRRTDTEVAAAMATCAGLVVPGVEDFGMTMAEIQAAGRPPVAFGVGGATDIVRDGETGFLFGEQTVEAVGGAMLRALHEPLDPDALVRSARRFDAAAFDAAIRGLVDEARTLEHAA